MRKVQLPSKEEPRVPEKDSLVMKLIAELEQRITEELTTQLPPAYRGAVNLRLLHSQVPPATHNGELQWRPPLLIRPRQRECMQQTMTMLAVPFTCWGCGAINHLL